jgi:hypothetical protein
VNILGRKIDGKKVTVGLIIAATAGLIGWDIVVAANKEKGDTISEVLLKSARKVPAVAFAWGVLSGHLFWPQDLSERNGKK